MLSTYGSHGNNNNKITKTYITRIIGNVVRKSIQTNLSLILNSLLFKNISDNSKWLSMPGIYSQLYNMLVGTISLSGGKDRKECICKCNGHRKRKPIYVELH